MNLLSCLQVTWFILAYAEACLVLFQIWSQLCISGYDNRLLSDPGTKLCCWCCDDVTHGTISHETSIIVYWLTSWFNSDLYSPELCTVVLLEGHFLSARLWQFWVKIHFPPFFLLLGATWSLLKASWGPLDTTLGTSVRDNPKQGAEFYLVSRQHMQKWFLTTLICFSGNSTRLYFPVCHECARCWKSSNWTVCQTTEQFVFPLLEEITVFL